MIMIWTEGEYYLPRYKYAGTNQHGDRFKRLPSKKIKVAGLSCKLNSSVDIQCLILLSHSLDVPVHYNFEDQVSYIEVISAEAVRRL